MNNPRSLKLIQQYPCATRLLPLLLLLALPAVVQAQFNYAINNGAITITRYTGPGGAVDIPSTISGLTVSSIGSGAFQDCYSLTSVTIPNSVTSIESYAFSGCNSLINVSIGNSVTNIAERVFDCDSLTTISVGALNPAFSAVAGVLLDKSQTTLIQCPRGKRGGYMIPSSVTKIGTFAFNACWWLTDITIPSSVTNIEIAAFYLCASLTSITVPNSVTSIGDWAFRSCNSLITVFIGNSVTNIGEFTFYECNHLTSIAVGALNPAFSGVDGVLFNKNQTTIIQCPEGRAGSYTIPNSVTSIGSHAFDSCTSLTSVTILDRVTSVGDGAFWCCASLTNVTIPNSVTSIGGVAFEACSHLTSIMIPNSVTSIGDGAFEGCTSLTSVAIPNSVTSIGGGTFNGCTNLTNVIIPDSVTSIGVQAFGACYRLTSVAIPNSVTSIGDRAFISCGLTSVAIPNSVTSIGAEAFRACASLTSVTMPDKLRSIGDYTFGSCTSMTSITIPNSVRIIGGSAFVSCTSLTNITIGNSVTYIGGFAFDYCTSLTGVYFNGNAPSLGCSLGFSSATVYYLPGTTGWGATYGGRPTAKWSPPTIWTSPQTQTAEAGAAVNLLVQASGPFPLLCLWYFNDTNLVSSSTTCELELTNVQFSQSGAYRAVITYAAGALTSSPAMLQVIPAVEHRQVPGVKVVGQAATLVNVDYVDSLRLAPNWATLGSATLTSSSQYWFDLTVPLPPQRFYRAWQTGAPGVIPSLDLHLVPALTLTGNIGDRLRLDYINQFGPIDAWVTLDTVTLTNTSQLYFDVSAPGQPQRLYRLVPVP